MGSEWTHQELLLFQQTLEKVRARYEQRERILLDPVHFVHNYPDRENQELVALLASTVAFGQVKSIRNSIENLLKRLRPSPAQIAERETELFARVEGWKHRLFKGEDLARLLGGARKVQQQYGSLGAYVERQFKETHSIRESLARFCDTVRKEGGLLLPVSKGRKREQKAMGKGSGHQRGRRGPLHLLPDVRANGGAKRLLLFLKWMVRPSNGIDLGLWNLPTSHLLVPVDVHIRRLARNLGLTQRKTASWKTTEEISAGLARLDPDDPTKYDFALCHLGMLQQCPSRRDEVRCRGCGVLPLCIHWRREEKGRLFP
ncbi:TIGR02757 family protein [Pajaroellobacter abortibovis]|uniref:TIGR02757 family protein n=1 Tax=Pajaroellobacter abortibovis TaxID=1882918 RepID=A0A1L6MXH2_9BACT|nr:TIGR02757 family protein [Pajaroellobacter abortibovis]APS00145.1 TIGR02757 family protein [Pajaroellobacter abortibovis]